MLPSQSLILSTFSLFPSLTTVTSPHLLNFRLLKHCLSSFSFFFLVSLIPLHHPSLSFFSPSLSTLPIVYQPCHAPSSQYFMLPIIFTLFYPSPETNSSHSFITFNFPILLNSFLPSHLKASSLHLHQLYLSPSFFSFTFISPPPFSSFPLTSSGTRANWKTTEVK